MRAIVIHGPGDLRLDELPEPVPASGEAVVAIRYGGICGSDLHYRAEGRVGVSVLREPMVLGHEIVGEVVTPAADGTGPAASTPVFVHPAQTCGHCAACRRGRSNLCETHRYLGSAARFPHTPGGFAERLAVPSARLVPVGGLDLRDAALVEPAAVAWHGVSRLAGGGDVRGQRIAVIGAGPIGLLVVAVLLARGAAEVLATDLHARPREVARSLGATAVLAAGDGAALEAWRPDHVVESSGSAAGLAAALAAVAPGGSVSVVGIPSGPRELAMPRVVADEVVVAGSSRFVDEPVEVVAALADGRLRVDGIVSHTLPVARFEEAFALAADGAASSKVLLEFG